MGRYDLTPALNTDCHTGLCFYGHPNGKEYRVQGVGKGQRRYKNVSEKKETLLKLLTLSIYRQG